MSLTNCCRKLDHYIPVLTTTVLKDSTGNKFRGELSTLEYLFKFLDAYDFASEGAEEIQEENKSLINASVLGLIFEKINGYKDGSFFTPGFITMYMSRETIRKAVVQKFNEVKGWKCETIENIYNQIEDRKEANDIINSLKICDPAVGSGHFLVSALNELISIKSDLKVLLDQDGKRLKEYQVMVVNDELIIFDEDGDFFEYKPSNNESQRVQVALFNEKQTIIENCLFGVDINPNSVKICRLRLWIELLKNAYYKNSEELETLPNIDINIKCGNSLISRFELNSDIKEALKKSKITISSYKKAVDTYRNANNKEQKREMEKLIEDIKNNFRIEIYSNDPKIKKLDRLKNEYGYLSGQSSLFDETVKERKLRKQKIVDLQTEINKIGSEIELIKSNKIYQNAFEWRFEFPEILNNSGEFTGFDIVIGNPPYFKEYTNRTDFEGIPYYQGKMDIWYSFACRGIDLLKPDGHLAFIATNNWTTSSGASLLRNKIIRETQIESLIDFSTYMVFDSAAIQTMIIQIKKNSEKDKYQLDFRRFISNKVDMQDAKKLLSKINSDKIEFILAMLRREDYVDSFLVFGNNEENKLLAKIKNKLNFNLYDGEVIQGIVSPQDFLNKKNALKINKPSQAGVGIFVLTDSEKESLQLTNDELGLIKPLYTTNEMARYSLTNTNNSWIIYTDSEFKESDSMDSYPNLKSHLDKFNTIITSDNKPYGLHRSRNKDFFIGDKIISLRKATTPTFTFTSCDCYVSQTFNIIKSNRINLKYLTGLLNSDLIRYWLKNKGKMQGDLYQVDKEPLLEIPIYLHGNPCQLANLVDKVIDTIKQGGEISDLESSINILVCKYYDLEYSEFQHITNNNLVTKDYYDNFLIN